MQRKAVSTVGEFLTELRGHWAGKPNTFGDYSRNFRTILSQIFGIKGGREKFDYVNGGRDAWVAKIDLIKLADVTPDKVNKWRIAFVKRADDNPVKQRRARISCNFHDAPDQEPFRGEFAGPCRDAQTGQAAV